MKKTFVRLDKNGYPKIIVETNDPTCIFTDDLETIDISNHPQRDEIARNPNYFTITRNHNNEKQLTKRPQTPPSKKP